MLCTPLSESICAVEPWLPLPSCSHYPEVDLELLKTLPPSPSGRVDMEHHYAACRGTADCIAQQIITESDRQRANQGVAAH
jgi:hypothetical protein